MTAAELIQALMANGMSEHEAKGVVSAWSSESGLNPSINEANPVVPGSRGGRGYYQLTGPRRVAFEKMYGDSYQPEHQVAFHQYEIEGPEAEAWAKVQQGQTPEEVAALYTQHFLRPGIDHSGGSAAKAASIADLDPYAPEADQLESATLNAWNAVPGVDGVLDANAPVDEYLNQFDVALKGSGGGGGGRTTMTTSNGRGGLPMMGMDPVEMSMAQKIKSGYADMADIYFSGIRGRAPVARGRGDAMRERFMEKNTRNATADWLETLGREDLAGLVRSGQVSGQQAANIIYGRGENDVTYGTTPRVFTDKDGKQRMGVIGNDGSIKWLDTEGAEYEGGVQKIKTKTGYVLYDRNSGQIIGEVDDNFEEEVAREYGVTLNEYNAQLNNMVPLLRTIDQMDEGMEQALGKFDSLQGKDNVLQAGTPGAEFITAHNQLIGKIFLDAYQQLKGGGQITEIEGQKAQEAMARMDRALTPDQYRKALSEFRAALLRGQDKLERLSRGEKIELSAEDREYLTFGPGAGDGDAPQEGVVW